MTTFLTIIIVLFKCQSVLLHFLHSSELQLNIHNQIKVNVLDRYLLNHSNKNVSYNLIKVIIAFSLLLHVFPPFLMINACECV